MANRCLPACFITRHVLSFAIRAMQKRIFRFHWKATWEDPGKQQILESISLLTVINHRLCQCLLLGMIKDRDPTTPLCSTAVTAGGFHMWAASRSFYTHVHPLFLCAVTLVEWILLHVCFYWSIKNNNNNTDSATRNPWPHTDTYKLANRQHVRRKCAVA